MRTQLLWRGLLVTMLIAGVAGAQEPRRVERAARYGGQGWSVLGGQSMGEGANALTATVGYPGLSVGFLHGASPTVDLGFRLAVNYAYEGVTTTLAPGLKSEFQARFQLLDAGSVFLGLELGAGFFGYFASSPGLGSQGLGMSLPVGLTLGLPVASALVVNLSLEAPLFITFGTFGGLTVPLLLGGGVEYFVDKRLAATLEVKMGPALYPVGFRAGSRADFALQANLGVAYKL